MSLRAFHLFFIAVSAVLAAFVGAWADQQWQAQHALPYALTTGAAFVSALALAFYFNAFRRKTRGLS
jgi:Flp pilus assembly protein protease CpaA